MSDFEIDKTNNIYIFPSFKNVFDVNPDTSKYFKLTPIGEYDMAIVKLDSNFKFKWAKQNKGTKNII